MKRFLVLLTVIFMTCLNVNADWDSGLTKINNVLNTVDRTEYTIDRAKRRVYIPSTASKAKTKTYGQNQSQTVTPPTYQNQNYGSGVQNYSNSVNTQYQNYNVDYDAPEYSVEQTIQEGAYKYNQDRVYKGASSTLGELPAGTVVMDPKSVWKFRNGMNYSGKISAEYPVFWMKLEDNHYVDGGTLLLSEVKVAEYPFCHSEKGLRDWGESDVRRFLRTTFYTHLSEGFKNAIVNVNIPYADLNGASKTINDNLFLLSIVEWGLSDRDNNGTVIKYDDLPRIYGAREFKYHEQDNNGKAYFDIGNYYDTNWTRTINRPKASSAGYRGDVFEILSSGVIKTDSYDSHIKAVRPAVNLKSSTKVSGPYKFVYDNRYQSFTKTLVYYVLEF